jgi:hypothetical protein
VTRTFVPHAYQLDAIEHIHKQPRCALWMPMGGGKTISTLTALEHLSCVEDVYPVLVLAPLRVAKTTWPDEVAKWDHTKHLRIVPVTGNVKQRLTSLMTPADVYTTNYEQLPWLVEHYGDRWPFKTVIADEQTRLKSYRTRQGSKRAKALAQVAHTKVNRFIGLTGTPSPNGLADLWGQTWFVDRGERLGRTYSAFEARWFKKGWDGFSVEPLPIAQKEIEGRLRDVCLTVTGLPVDEPIVNNIYIDLPSSARTLYNEMEREMFMEIEEHGIEALNAAAKTMKLLQVANGAAYIDDQKNWKEVHHEKIEALGSIVEEAAGAPVLVAYHFQSDHARLRAAFPKARTLDADPATIHQWNAGRIPILLAHPACLHPETEVLTESRGWVRIIDVRRDERVFDGVEFVAHGGCSFSGVRPVIERFGITLTPNHKLLIGRRWVEAKDVRDHPDTAEKARYSYSGADPYLGAMLPMRRRAGDAVAERRARQQGAARVLPGVPGGQLSPDDRNAVLVDLEGDALPGDGPEKPGLGALWGRRSGCGRSVAVVQEFLQRHVRGLQRRSDPGSGGQLEGLQQGQLPVGVEPSTTGEQKQQSGDPLPGPRHTFGGVLSRSRSVEGGDSASFKCRDERRGGAERLCQLPVQEEPQASVSPVYDIVDCGPRHRFLVRNAKGDVFVSHNSAGHGLDLQYGGNILAFFSLNWSLENYMQIIERIGPMRQKQAGFDRPVFVHHIMAAKTVDDMVLERLASKRTVQEILLDAMKRRKQ